MQRWETADLLQDIGRGVEEHPTLTIGADGDGRLGACLEAWVANAHTVAVGAVAVPLRKATASGRAQDMDFHGTGFTSVFKNVFGEPTRQAHPAGWLRSKVCNQRLEMYIVISKPRRMSIAAGFSHVIRLLLQVTPANCGQRTGSASVSTSASIGAAVCLQHRQIMDSHLMIFMSLCRAFASAKRLRLA